MEKIPTVEEFLPKNSNGMYLRNEVEKAIVEFAKLHVNAALKEAMYMADEKEISSMSANEYYREQILNSYPLDKIK